MCTYLSVTLLPAESPLHLKWRFLLLAHNVWPPSLTSHPITLHLVLYAPATPAFQVPKCTKFVLVLGLLCRLTLECSKSSWVHSCSFLSLRVHPKCPPPSESTFPNSPSEIPTQSQCVTLLQFSAYQLPPLDICCLCTHLFDFLCQAIRCKLHKRTGILSVLFMAVRISPFYTSKQNKNTTNIFILLISYGAS